MGRNPQTGEWEDYPNFVDCTMFGTRAEAVSRFLAKGNKVALDPQQREAELKKAQKDQDYFCNP